MESGGGSARVYPCPEGKPIMIAMIKLEWAEVGRIWRRALSVTRGALSRNGLLFKKVGRSNVHLLTTRFWNLTRLLALGLATA